jgi:hypothetical protein
MLHGLAYKLLLALKNGRRIRTKEGSKEDKKE